MGVKRDDRSPTVAASQLSRKTSRGSSAGPLASLLGGMLRRSSSSWARTPGAGSFMITRPALRIDGGTCGVVSTVRTLAKEISCKGR